MFILLGLGLIFLASAAVAKFQTEPRPFDVGLSTTAGNHIYVQRIIFDNEWWAAGGEITGDWQQAGSTSGIHGRRMPREALIRWQQEDTGVNYEATVRLDENLAKMARNLPGYTRIADGRKFDASIYLIVGMRPDGKVIVWLSNARSEGNLQGRVLHVVGEAQAVEIPAVNFE
jgi:hypothetical protein